MTVSELKYMIAVNELSENVGAKLTAIAAKLGVSKVSVYKALERLEAGGYLIHNGKKINLTEKGERVLSEYMVVIDFIERHLAYHCGTPQEIAYNDALGAACMFSDISRQNVVKLVMKKTAGTENTDL